MTEQHPERDGSHVSRRGLLQAVGAIGGASVLGSVGGNVVSAQNVAENTATEKRVIQKRRIHQSLMGWCFNPMPTIELAQHAADLGFEAIEGIDSKFYPDVQKLGLKISLVSSHGFQQGPLDPANHDFCMEKLTAAIELAAKVGSQRVITFTGMRKDGISDAAAEENCVKLWKELIPLAEKHRIFLCLEHLNTRDDSHPMKGHPGYFGDDVERCIRLIQKVDSPWMKLLFDIYHVQIMHGDIIRRIRKYHPWIGHYHTAGNPGRCEIDEKQEIQYPPILNAILETGYDGYVAQEFIPTWQDPIAALRHAAGVCDI
ncbi:MAG: TIM barrel protein [Planctomycetaceae bacterium]|nr:TIM barrel protein [Planctomycetaceae bacterium]